MFGRVQQRLATRLNRVTLVGTVRDVQNGFLSDEPCVQFQLVTHEVEPPLAPPEMMSTTETVPLARRTTGTVKQQFTVRCQNARTEKEMVDLRTLLHEGMVVKCIGQLRVNVQTDSGKRHPHPFIAVDLSGTMGALVPLVTHGRIYKPVAPR